jgi:hypothetical protein
METAGSAETADRNGNVVLVGTTVRVLSIPDSVFVELPESEVVELKSMIGATFVVDEIDQWGNAWVSSMRETSPGEHHGHGLALAPGEMEVVASGSSDA